MANPPSTFNIRPSGNFQLAGSELLLTSSEDTDVEARLSISSACAAALYNLLQFAGMSRDVHRTQSYEEMFSSSLKGNPAAPRSPVLLEKMYQYLHEDWTLAQNVSEDRGFEGAPSLICTFFEIDSGLNKEELLKQMRSIVPPSRISFTLNRVIARPIPVRSLGEDLDSRPKIETSVICKLRYALDCKVDGHGSRSYVLSFSTSMSVATDRVSSKYEIQGEKYSIAGLASMMFLRPLRELTRVAYRVARPRKNLAAESGRPVIEEEVILNDFPPLHESSLVGGLAPFYNVWALTPDGTDTIQVLLPGEKPAPISKSELGLLDECRLASVVLSTSLQVETLLDHDLSDSAEAKTVKLFLDRILSCVRAPYEVFTATENGTRLKVRPHQVRLRVDDLNRKPKTKKRSAASYMADFIGCTELTNEDTSFDIYTDRADGYGRLYTVSLRSFDHGRLMKELSIADDLSLDDHRRESKQEFLRRKVTACASSLEVKLHVYHTALSRKGSMGIEDTRARSARDLIDHLTSNREDLKQAFQFDFDEAFRILNLSYWLRPHFWMPSLINRERFRSVASEAELEIEGEISEEELETYREAVRLSVELRNAHPSSDFVLNQVPSATEGWFFLRNSAKSRDRKQGSRSVSNPFALAALLHGWMVNRKTSSIVEALATAPFLSLEVRKHYGLNNLHVYNRRLPAFLKEVQGNMLRLFKVDPAYPFAIQCDIFETYHRYFFGVTGDADKTPLHVKFDRDWSTVSKVLPKVARSAYLISKDSSPAVAPVVVGKNFAKTRAKD